MTHTAPGRYSWWRDRLVILFHVVIVLAVVQGPGCKAAVTEAGFVLCPVAIKILNPNEDTEAMIGVERRLNSSRFIPGGEMTVSKKVAVGGSGPPIVPVGLPR